MVEPTGYTALDLIGFTDKGLYDPLANYVRNDLVHVGNSTWRCKIDDTTGITPTEGANWTIFIESATSLAGMSDVDLNTPKAGDGLVHDGNDWTNIPIMTKEQWKKNGAYNLLENTATSQVVQGVTFTVNPTGYKKGAIKLYSTAAPTGGVDFKVNAGFKLPAGTYKLVPNDFPSTSYSSRISVTISGGAEVAWDANYDNHAHCEFTLSEEKELVYHIYMNTTSIGALNNIIIYPMITTDMNATSADFEEFAKTNRQLTEVLGNVKEIRTGKFNFTNGASISGSVTYDTPFTGTGTKLVLITPESGNTAQIHVFCVNGQSNTGFNYIAQNITGDTSSSTRVAQYIAISY